MYTTDDQEYINRITLRAKHLIQSRIWDSISEQSLDHWLSGLSLLKAELLGAYILDNLTYRTKDQYLSLLSSLVDQIFITLPQDTEPLSFINAFTSRLQHPIALSPVIGLNEPPTKSGPYILRLAQRKFRLKSTCMYWPNHLIQLEKLKYVIFIDDFCGSGKQFLDFLNSINFKELLLKFPDLEVVYAVTTIHEHGYETIKKNYSQIKIFYAEYLTHSNSNLLNDEFLDRYSINGFREKIREQYENVCLHVKPSSKFKYGYGSLGLSYSFAHSTPNNSLPILWMDSDALPPLVER